MASFHIFSQEYLVKYSCFWRRQWHPTPYFCLENPMDGGAWQAAVHGVAKSRTRLSDFTFTFHFHALVKEMATHSSVLAWRIPGMGSLVGCRLWGCTESDTTEATQQQQHSCFGGSDGKVSACSAGDLGCIPGSGISLGKGNGYSLQYPFLEKSIDRGNQWAIVHGLAKSLHD